MKNLFLPNNHEILQVQATWNTSRVICQSCQIIFKHGTRENPYLSQYPYPKPIQPIIIDRSSYSTNETVSGQNVYEIYG